MGSWVFLFFFFFKPTEVNDEGGLTSVQFVLISIFLFRAQHGAAP